MSEIDILARIEADVDDGGWQASGSVIGDADRLDFYQELESWFYLHTSAGWESVARPAFLGHLIPAPWEKTFQTSLAPLEAFTAQEFFKRGRIQGIFFKEAASPANDHQITGMTYAAIFQHVMGQSGEYGHCNFVRGVWPEGIVTLDVDSTNSSATDEYEIKEGNFWSKLKELARIDFYELWVDKNNTVFFKPHPMFGASLPTAVFTLTSDWLLEPLSIETRNSEAIGQIKLQGVTPRGLQITGEYPTEATAGPIVVRGGYVATADTKMDTIAERMYKYENRSHTVTVRIGNGVGLMIDLMDRIGITYASAADGINWSNKKFWIHKIQVDILSNFTAQTTLKLEAENA